MTNLPQGWTLAEPGDEYGPHVLRQDGTALAAVRLRASVEMRDAVVGSWEWYSLSGAGDDVWYEERGFHDFDDAVAAAIGKVSKTKLWTIAEVADYLGAASTGSARKTLSRWSVKAVARQPGRAGASLYDPAQVSAARASAPGQGKRTDRTTD